MLQLLMVHDSHLAIDGCDLSCARRTLEQATSPPQLMWSSASSTWPRAPPRLPRRTSSASRPVAPSCWGPLTRRPEPKPSRLQRLFAATLDADRRTSSDGMPPDQAGGGYVRQPSPCRPRVSASGSTSCPLIRIVGDPGNRRASASSGLPISVSV